MRLRYIQQVVESHLVSVNSVDPIMASIFFAVNNSAGYVEVLEEITELK